MIISFFFTVFNNILVQFTLKSVENVQVFLVKLTTRPESKKNTASGFACDALFGNP